MPRDHGYPAGPPANKHDLLCPSGLLPPPDDGSGADEGDVPSSEALHDDIMLLRSASEILRALDDFRAGGGASAAAAAARLQNLCSVYSYDDGPRPPLSRGLAVVGVARQSLGSVRKLLAGGGTGGNGGGGGAEARLLRPCAVAVKRGDGPSNFARLDPRRDVPNSASFARLCRLLRREGLVAVVAPDKYGRFALLRPSAADAVHENGEQGEGRQQPRRRRPSSSALPDLPPEDFYAELFVGRLEEAREYLASSGSAASDREQLEDAPPPSSSPIWQPSTPPVPPPPDDHDREQTSSPVFRPSTPPLDDSNFISGSAPMWQPPGDDDTGEGGLWEPPGAAGRDGGGGQDGYGDSGGLWQPPAGAYGWSAEENGGGGGGNDKRRRDGGDDEDEDGGGDGAASSSSAEFHADSGAAAADAFYSGLTRTLDTRADSRIYHMRAFNGWVKATQIQELDPKSSAPAAKGRPGHRQPQRGGLRVLDLACGKGGDLGKWALHPRGISNYVGIDVARGSLRDAAVRARAPNLRPKLPRCTFTCADLGSDVPGRPKSSRGKGKMQRLLTWSLQDEPPHSEGPPEFRLARGGGVSPGDRFDAVSIQFAIHYMMSSRYAFSFFASFARRDGWNIPSQLDVWTCEI
jgi:mRNA (guanine-N7-)-methyltransferase